MGKEYCINMSHSLIDYDLIEIESRGVEKLDRLRCLFEENFKHESEKD